MPNGFGRATNWSRFACQRASVTMMAPSGGSCSSSFTNVQRSSAMPLALMSGIELLLEWLEADAAICVEEALVLAAQLQVGIDDGLDGTDNPIGAEGRADDIADRRV